VIPTQEKTVTNEIKGSLRSKRMTLDPDSITHIMGILTDLYSDPAMAVIREYTLNAIDSHAAAGKGDVPVTIGLPTAFSDTFVVKDEGIGMDEEEVFNTFGSYGASTKRESDNYTGQLGLGCKSGLTLTNQFSLVAIKDGIKCAFSVHKDEFGVPCITKLYQGLTDAHNGVEVSIAIKDVEEFKKRAARFFPFVTPIPVFLNEFSVQTKPILEISPSIKIVDSTQDCVVMGNVPYPFVHDKLFRTLTRPSIVLYAKMGEVNFTPSRESLHYTAKTKDFLNRKYEELEDKLASKISQDLDLADNYAEACKLCRDKKYYALLIDLSAMKVPMFHGEEVSSSLYAFSPIKSYYLDNGKLKFKRKGTTSFYTDNLGITVLIHDNPYLTSTNRRKLKIFMLEKGLNEVYYITNSLDSYFSPIVSTQMKTITIEDLKYIKLPSRSGKCESKWPRLEVKRHTAWSRQVEFVMDTEAEVKARKGDIVFLSRGPLKINAYTLTSLFPDTYFYAVPASRAPSFRHLSPRARSINEFLLNQLIKIENSMTDAQKLRVAGIPSQALIKLSPNILSSDQIQDKQLRAFGQKIVAVDEAVIKIHNEPWSTFRRICTTSGLAELVMDIGQDIRESFIKESDALAKKYPLLFVSQDRTFTQSYIDYVNERNL